MATKTNATNETKITNVRTNAACIFAAIEDVKELKALAQRIVNDIHRDYEARRAEIMAKTKTVVVSIEVEKSEAAVEVETQKTESKPKAKAKAEPKEKKETKPESKPKEDDTPIAITDLKAIRKLDLKFEKYTDNFWILYGDTKRIKDIIKSEFDGGFFKTLKRREDIKNAWCIRTKYVGEVAKMLGRKIETA